MTLKISIADVLTGEIIERDMTKDEFAFYEADSARRAKIIAASETKKAEEAKKKELALQKLEALGLTVDDIKALNLA